MTTKVEAQAVTSGTSYTWPPATGGASITDYENHMIVVTSGGSGVGTITADLGNAVYVAVAALAAPAYDTYLLPNCTGIKIAATVADIVVSIKSYNSTEK